MLSRLSVSSDQQLLIFAKMRVAGPNLGAIHDQIVAFHPGMGLQAGEIGAGVGFGEPLAPRYFPAENPWQVELFLSLISARHDRRRRVVQRAEEQRLVRSARPGVFFVEDQLTHSRK